MSARQLQNLLTNAFPKFQAECSNLRSDFLTITEQFDSKLQAATENITAKL